MSGIFFNIIVKVNCTWVTYDVYNFLSSTNLVILKTEVWEWRKKLEILELRFGKFVQVLRLPSVFFCKFT